MLACRSPLLGRGPFRYLLVTLAVASVALAVEKEQAKADPLGVVGGEALDLTADELDIDVNGGTAVLVGNVRVELGDLEVTCPRVEIRYDAAPEVHWARGSGGVEARFKDIQARAKVVEVDVPKHKMTLTGGVHLKRGRGWVHAETATLDLATRHVSLQNVKGSIPVETPDR